MKLLTIALIAILVVGGTVIGLGYTGFVRIPGITPEKRKTTGGADLQSPKTETANTTNDPASQVAPNNANANHSGTISPTNNAAANASSVANQGPSIAQEEAATTTQRKDGTVRLAKLWSSMDAEALKRILTKWEDGDALPVLAKMQDAKLAELLTAIATDDPDRAAKISKGIKALEKGGQ